MLLLSSIYLGGRDYVEVDDEKDEDDQEDNEFESLNSSFISDCSQFSMQPNKR